MAGADEPRRIYGLHSGVTGCHFKQYLVQSGLLSSLNVVAMIGVKNGETRYGLVKRHLSTGVGWSFFNAARSYRTQLPYEEVRREVLSCHAGCTRQKCGSIKLSEAQFRRAAVSGLDFKLVRRNRSVVAKAPPEAFRAALALSGHSGSGWACRRALVGGGAATNLQRAPRRALG